MSQPKSYLAVLVCVVDVLAKGVEHIKHDGADGYYRCLLALPSESLAVVLASMHGKNNAWFMQQLKQVSASIADEPPSDVEAAGLEVADLPLLPIGDLSPDIVGDDILLPPLALQLGFSRVIVDMGQGTPRCKVYFDNFSGAASGCQQRGFLNCTHHTCIKYRVVGADSKVEFCSRAYLWWLEGANIADRDKHLEWEPADADVHAAIPSICMHSF